MGAVVDHLEGWTSLEGREELFISLARWFPHFPHQLIFILLSAVCPELCFMAMILISPHDQGGK